MSALRKGSVALSPPGTGSLWLSWILMAGVALGSGPWSFPAGCPSSCSCSGTRISCVDQKKGIVAFPVLQNELEMENITEIFIANQSSFTSINDKDLSNYKNLRNLTVTNSRLTYVSRLAFQNNLKLQYLNLKDNNLPSLSWRIFRHLNISYLVLAGNPLHCSCENMWMKLWLGEEADSQEVRCIEEGGNRKLLSRLTLPNCVVPSVTLSPSNVTVKEKEDLMMTCNKSGDPSPDLIWNMSITTNYEIQMSGQLSVLHLFNISSLDHNSRITCIGENIVGERESSVLLDVLFPPNITKLSDAIPDHHWCIPFSVAGNPKPQLRWLQDGEEVKQGEFIVTKIHDVTEREYHGCLQLDIPTHLNNGLYTLIATNKLGEDKMDVFAHFMVDPLGPVSDPPYYDQTTDGPPADPPEDRVAVYVVVGIAAVAFTGFLLMLIILKFGGNSKFGIKGFVLFQNIPVEVVSH